MKKIALVVYRYLVAFGINLIHLFYWIKNIPRYLTTYSKIKKKWAREFWNINLSYPCLHDKDDDSWTARWHYFHQDLLIAQKIFKNNPKKHVDIWSRVDWFCAHVATFREIEVLDIRKNDSVIDNIIFIQWDATAENTKYVEYADSVSCLHAIEHFWLWRYWDPINVNGHLKGIEFINKMLKKDWILYFSTPIGKEQRIEFNAHRIFSLKYLYEILWIWEKYELLSFSYVDDKWELHKNQNIQEWLTDTYNLNYWCGIFELKKIQ